MDERERAYDLFKKIHASPGMAYLNRKKLRAFSTNIFLGNYRELKKICEYVENPDIGVKLMSEDMMPQGTYVHMEVMRLFHNFLASAKSLVEHSRLFVMEHYSNSPIQQAYQQKISDELSIEPVIKFVEDLRNYMLHRTLPQGSMSLTISNVQGGFAKEVETTVSIDKDALLSWKGWSSKSKLYLGSANKTIKISAISDDYAKHIIAFNSWLEHKLDKFHEVDVSNLAKMQQEYSLFSGG